MGYCGLERSCLRRLWRFSPPATPFIEKILAGTRLQLQPTGSRWTYEVYLRHHHQMAEEEEHEFKDLWKLLLLKPIRDDL